MKLVSRKEETVLQYVIDTMTKVSESCSGLSFLEAEARCKGALMVLTEIDWVADGAVAALCQNFLTGNTEMVVHFALNQDDSTTYEIVTSFV